MENMFVGSLVCLFVFFFLFFCFCFNAQNITKDLIQLITPNRFLVLEETLLRVCVCICLTNVLLHQLRHLHANVGLAAAVFFFCFLVLLFEFISKLPRSRTELKKKKIVGIVDVTKILLDFVLINAIRFNSYKICVMHSI